MRFLDYDIILRCLNPDAKIIYDFDPENSKAIIRKQKSHNNSKAIIRKQKSHNNSKEWLLIMPTMPGGYKIFQNPSDPQAS